MRAENRSRLASVSLPLSLAYLLSVVALPGCGKIKELLGEEEAEVAEAAPQAAEEKVAPEPPEPEPEPAPVEEIPEKPPATGLDALLELVPEADTEFAIVRDASVLVDYAEEAGRFLDGPMAKLEADAEPLPDVKEMVDSFNEFQKVRTAGIGMVKTAGIKLDQGVAFVGAGSKKGVMIYAADNPNAWVDFLKAVDEAEAAKITCKKLEEKPGYNVCSEDKAGLEAYKPKGDPAALRTALSEALPGIDLEKVNMVAHGKEGGDTFVAVTTTPGLVSVAVSGTSSELKEATSVLKPTEAKLLGAVQPGAGFLWWNADMSKASGFASDVPPPLNNLVGKLTGEVLIGGSVEPPAIMLEAAVSDVTAFSGLVDMAVAGKEDVPKEVPGVPGSEVIFEQADVTIAGSAAKALHVGIGGVPESQILSSQTGLNLEGWMFAAGDRVTVAIGPGADSVGKLAEAPAKMSAGTLAALPPGLADSLGKNEVSFVVHLPVDAVHGPVVRKLVGSALKNVPDAKPERLQAGLAMFSPVSTLTGWVAHRGDKPVVFVAMQGIGNRATNEGKAALDAAHAVADGADPATAFSGMAATYANSPRVSAYQARAGTLPGALAGSAVGAIMATAALAVPMAVGARNESLADELGIQPPPPEEPPKVADKRTPKKPKTPKKPDTPKPGPGPVEPPKPTPDVPKPTPTPDVPKPTPTPDTPKPKPGTGIKVKPIKPSG